MRPGQAFAGIIVIDVLYRAARLGYRIAEFPVHWSNDPDTRIQPVSGALQNFGELCRIRWDVNVRHRRAE